MPVLRGGAVMAAPAYGDAPFVASGSGTSWGGSYGHAAAYQQMYPSQTSVRTVIDFLSRNIAQLGLHWFRRVSDTDRVRLNDHPLAQWFESPTPYVTRYGLIESLVADLGIHWNAYWLKLRDDARVYLQRLPPGEVQVIGGLVPQAFLWTTSNGRSYEFPREDIVQFRGYNPIDPLCGISPLETLRTLLDEDSAATRHRAALWRNAARIEGVIERPAAAKPWNNDQVESFRAMWRNKFGGDAGVGQVPILQDGMTFRQIAFSPRQTEYVAARKLTREEVAAAYHVPLPMVGILDHATYSNVREQHKQLYADTLGPWLELIASEIMRQVLPEARDSDHVYCEFNIAEKLSGSFEEQAGALQTLVGTPIMTANEGRARINLPAMKEAEADQLVRPLNTAAITDTPAAGKVLPFPQRVPADDDDDAIAIGPVIEQAWKRQASVLAKVDPLFRADAFDDDRWQRELTADLIPVYRAAGIDDLRATKRAERLAYIVNADTRTYLAAGIAAFSPHREASSYVP